MNEFETIWAERVKFFAVFFLVFTISYVFLVAIDFVPEPKEGEEGTEVVERAIAASESEASEPAVMVEQNQDESTEEAVELPNISIAPEAEAVDTNIRQPQPEITLSGQVLPTEIYIPKLNRTTQVLNPTSRSIADLDDALLDGVVRHPDSATLNQQGNVFILGHSSYLPNVFNRNFQAFNGLQDLAWGDTIEVSGGGMVFEYRVEKVYEASATDTTVPIAGEGHRLILATCDSFGSVDDRFIVEAKRVGVREQ